ncbi:N-alpha-acetyltransferase MAK3 [Vitis vinifera]|uniref:N-alpha-acetyltransferase MAK3 n=1 Tax=Vitis vinifera TaxID=29760 RepID=A0A438EBN6_VITVI|nr:N-alpha-acetyltransferase MAK3 [Vitis vinifera]
METRSEEEGSRVELIDASEIEYVSYGGEHHLPLVMHLVDQELSEPYSIFTYRYFVYLWPHLSFLAFHKGKCVGTVVCKMGEHRNTFRGYIAMLVVIKPYRGRGIATELVTRSIKVMMESGCEEVTLEAEVTNKGALALYGRLGFIRAKRLFRYYLNGVDAFRLKLLLPRPELHPSLPMMRIEMNPTHMMITYHLKKALSSIEAFLGSNTGQTYSELVIGGETSQGCDTFME